jgi:F-type H+-transporting ATPase subunit b
VSINLTLLGQMITFLLFVWFTKAFVWPPLIKALKERQEKIADGLAAAERGRQELVQAKEQNLLSLKKTIEEAADIIVTAKKQADNIIETARLQAKEEELRIIKQGHTEVEHMASQAKETLRKQVGALAIMGAQKILEHAVDEKAHNAMLEKLAQEI